MKETLRGFINGILAGISIAIGGTAFLAVDNKIVGALLFAVGLFTICSFGFSLFTGKVCYVFDNKPSYALSLISIWLGNFLGTFLAAKAELFTRIAPAMSEKAKAISEAKLGDSILSVFILAIFCNILIYISVESYKSCESYAGKYLGLMFGVVVFVLCGFEHCVANMYYFSVASVWSSKALLYIFVITLGNSVGGVVIPLLRKIVGSVRING